MADLDAYTQATLAYIAALERKLDAGQDEILRLRIELAQYREAAKEAEYTKGGDHAQA